MALLLLSLACRSGEGRGGETTEPAPTAETVPEPIELDQAVVDEIRESFVARWNRLPEPSEIEGLLDARIREEVLSREALALGLDRDDPVIRRALATKVETILKGLGDGEPNDEELRAHLEAHPDRYRVEPRLSFTQVYLRTDDAGEPAAIEARAASVLRDLEAAPDPIAAAEGAGDPLMIDRHFPLRRSGDIDRRFGQGFAGKLMDLEIGRWQGPVLSGFGAHLVLVHAREPGRAPALDEVREAVRRDLRTLWQRESVEANYARIRAGYAVSVAGRLVDPPSSAGDVP